MGPDERALLHEALRDTKEIKQHRKALIIIALLLILLLLLWLVPYYAFPEQAKAGNVPTLQEAAYIGQMPPRPSGPITAYITVDQTTKLTAANVVVSACYSTEKNCYAQSLYYFVRDNIKYVSDPLDEYYELPVETLLAGSADCDGMAILLASLLRSVGIETRFEYYPEHVYVQAWLPDTSVFAPKNTYKWVSLDPTCKSCKPGELAWNSP